MIVTLVPFEHIDRVWDGVKPWLEPAVQVTNGRFTTWDVYTLLQQQRLHLWIALDDDNVIHGIEVTQIIDYPSKRVLASLFTGGQRLRDWREPMMDILIRWARDNQCEAIEGHGRSGWIKMLEPYGVRAGLVHFEKEI